MASSDYNWLAFSLSNPSLFQPPYLNGCSVAGGEEEFANRGGDDLSGLPKLENFLGGGGAAGASLDQFSLAKSPVGLSDAEIYESELKTIAASFLRGFSSDQTDAQKLPEPSPKKSVDTFGQRTSIYRGVTRHRWTGRYEAHLWDNSCRREGQSRKGRQVYLGGYDKEEKAARAYDLAALKYWGPTTTTNFPVSDYEKELESMKNMTRQEFVASLRRKSSGFSRGASIYRGVTRHHQHGRWQARIGRVAGNKDLYLGTFGTQEEAAEAYDIAAIKFRGLNAVTNFDMSRYDVKSIANSNLPIGGGTTAGKSTKASDQSRRSEEQEQEQLLLSNTLVFSKPLKQDDEYWSAAAAMGYSQQQQGSSSSQLTLNIHNNIVNVNVNVKNSQEQEARMESSFPFQISCSNLTMDGLVGGHGYNIQAQESSGRSNSSCSSIPLPYSAPTPFHIINSYDYEVSAGRRYSSNSTNSSSWAAGKPTLSVFQTPIFGME